MNDHQRAERIFAARLIHEHCKLYAAALVASGVISQQDEQSATLAVLLRAVEVYTKEVGINPDRVLVRPE